MTFKSIYLPIYSQEMAMMDGPKLGILVAQMVVGRILMSLLSSPFSNVQSPSFLQDNTNIDAAVTCLVKNIMSLEEESALSAAAASKTEAEGSVLVLPRFDYSKREKGFDGCSGCPSLKSKDRDCDCD